MWAGTLVFDGECGFCTRTVRLFDRLDRHHRVRRIPLQGTEAKELTGLDYPQLKESVRWVTPGGDCLAGAEAVNAALSAILGTSAPSRVYRLPGVRQGQEAAYRWIAANRHRFPGVTPWCSQVPGECQS